jgi:hypothetical protein
MLVGTTESVAGLSAKQMETVEACQDGVSLTRSALGLKSKEKPDEKKLRY